MTYFSHARTGLKYGLKALGLKQGDQILVPDFVCDALVHPIKDLRLTIHYYPLNDSLEPSWDVLEAIAMGNDCRAIVMVHYFGQPQDIQRFRRFCTDHRLLLVEDNAHGFGGTVDGKLLGTFGDLGITSPRKVLDVASGGILYINGRVTLPPTLPLYRINFSEFFLRKLFGLWPYLKVTVFRIAGRLPDFIDPAALREPIVGDKVTDVRSTALINAVIAGDNLWDLARKRRERWLFLERWIQDKNLRPLFNSLHPDSSPWVFPVYAESPQSRDRVLAMALRHGFIFFPWPTLPSEIIALDGDAVHRWRRLVCIPLNQDPQPLATQ